MKTFYSHLEDWPAGAMVRLFNTHYGLTQVKDPADADVIIWNGGEDIGTEIYGERPASHGVPGHKSNRDIEEIAMFEKFAATPGKLLLGICRGSQLLNCLNGGKLYQDVNNHGSSHPMIDLRTGEVLEVTSTHHQQMRPNPKEGEVIGVADCSTVKRSDSDGTEKFIPAGLIKNGRDVEIVWYPKTHTLCVQGHPEYVPKSRFAKYTLELLQQCWAHARLAAEVAA